MTTPASNLDALSDLQSFLYQEANHCPLGQLTCAAPTTRSPPLPMTSLSAIAQSPAGFRHRKQAQRDDGSGPRPHSKGPEDSSPALPYRKSQRARTLPQSPASPGLAQPEPSTPCVRKGPG